MSILVSLQHVTRYRYDRRGDAWTADHQAAAGAALPDARFASYSLKVTPAEHFVNWLQDPNGNWLARFVFPERTTEFTITVDLLADMSVINPFDFFIDPIAADFPFSYPAEFNEELAPFLSKEPAGPRLAEFLASISREKMNSVDFIVALNQRLQHDIRYLVRMDPGVQTPEETLAARLRIVPRHGVADGANSPASRPRGPLRVRLPHPVDVPI